jgi:hypothetical protein
MRCLQLLVPWLVRHGDAVVHATRLVLCARSSDSVVSLRRVVIDALLTCAVEAAVATLAIWPPR